MKYLLALFVISTAAGQSETAIFVSGQDREYAQLDQPYQVTLKGPGVFRFVARLRFTPDMPENASFRLQFRQNGGPWQSAVYQQVQRSKRALFRQVELGIPSRLQDFQLELGRGYHNIEIRRGDLNKDIYARHLFEKKKARRTAWAPITPLFQPKLVELIARENFVLITVPRKTHPTLSK